VTDHGLLVALLALVALQAVGLLWLVWRRLTEPTDTTEPVNDAERLQATADAIIDAMPTASGSSANCAPKCKAAPAAPARS
jgi:hypothetical protein